MTWSHYRTIESQQAWVFDIGFSHDGTVIASSSFADKNIRLLDVEIEQTIAVLELGFFALNPVSPEIAIAHNKGIRFYDCRTGEFIRQKQLAFEPLYLDFSPDGSQIATALDTPLIYLVETLGENVREINAHDLVAHPVFSPNGKSLAIAHDSGAVTLWDVESGEQIGSDYGDFDRPEAPNFSPDSKLLVCGGGGRSGGIIEMWDISE